MQINQASTLATELRPHIGERFTLIDVGASGGIAPLWQQFGEHLSAVGFEPLVAEAERLKSTETAGRTRYECAFVSCDEQDIRDGLNGAGLLNTHCFHRTSAMRAANATKANYIQERFNGSAPIVYSDRTITIDGFCAEESIDTVDFIKVDTDGHDYYVLQGARQTLKAHGTLGVLVECPLHGTPHQHANTFTNIDRFMRECGFALFDLTPWHYTRAALPGQFFYNIPAQTVGGQIQWCDAIYFLDPITRPALFETLQPAQIVKLLILYDLFSLPDCAAELIVEMESRGLYLDGISYAHILDLLAPNGNYRDHVAAFDVDPSSFYPKSPLPLPEPPAWLRSFARRARNTLKRAIATANIPSSR